MKCKNLLIWENNKYKYIICLSSAFALRVQKVKAQNKPLSLLVNLADDELMIYFFGKISQNILKMSSAEIFTQHVKR